MRAVAYWMTLLMTFTLPWENSLTLPFLGTAGRMTGALVFGAWMMSVILRPELRMPRPIHWAIYAFFMFNAISCFWTVDAEDSMSRLTTFAQLVALVFVMWDILRTDDALHGVLQAYVLGVYVSIANILMNYRGADVEGETFERFGAAGFNLNDIGLIIALSIPMAWYLALFARGRFDRWYWRAINVACVPAALMAIMLTGSRGSLVSTIPAALFLLATVTRLGGKSRVAAAIVFAGAAVAVFFVVPESLLERLGSTGDSVAQGDFGGRGKIWVTAWNAFQKQPLFGYGTGTSSDVIQRSAHNVYLSVIVDLGLIGLSLLLAVLALALWDALRQPGWSGRMCLALLTTLALGSLVHTWEQRKQTWFVIGAVAACAELATRPPRRLVPLAPGAVPSGAYGPPPGMPRPVASGQFYRPKGGYHEA